MNRPDIAYLLIALIVAVGTTMWVFSYRFLAYQREVRRGRRSPRPVWKPFWMK